MKKVKIAVIGVGNIAEEHIEAYIKNPNVELYAFCDIREKRLEEMGKRYNVTRLFTDKDEMLKLPEIDAVSVCTWNSEHAPCTIAALNAGKHVLCEKPMATTTEDAIKMKEAAEKNGKLLMIGFVRRFGDDCKIIKEFGDIDYLGEIYYAKTSYLRRNGNPGGWFSDNARSGGGPLMDLGVHVIDFTRYVMGNPKPVSVYGATFKKLYDRNNLKTTKAYIASSKTEDDNVCDVEDLATALVRYDNGAVLSVEASFSLNIKKGKGIIELFGTKGGAKFEPDLELYTELNGYMADVQLDAKTILDFTYVFSNEINHFVDCIMNGTECMSPAQDGVEVMKILEAIYESARTGHEVILD